MAARCPPTALGRGGLPFPPSLSHPPSAPCLTLTPSCAPHPSPVHSTPSGELLSVPQSPALSWVPHPRPHPTPPIPRGCPLICGGVRESGVLTPSCPQVLHVVIFLLPLHLLVSRINETKITLHNFWGIRAIPLGGGRSGGRPELPEVGG